MAAYVGYKGRMTVNGTVLRLHSYDIEYFADNFDTSHFENVAGVEEWTLGIRGAELNIEAHWRSEDNPFTLPLLLHPGFQVTNVVVTLDRTNFPATRWTFLTMEVIRAKMSQKVRDVINYSISLKNTTTEITAPTN